MTDNFTIRTATASEANDDYFTLDDDEEILDVVKHGTVYKAIILTPVEFECGYIKDDGEPCEITVSGSEERCHHHA